MEPQGSPMLTSDLANMIIEMIEQHGQDVGISLISLMKASTRVTQILGVEAAAETYGQEAAEELRAKYGISRLEWNENWRAYARQLGQL